MAVERYVAVLHILAFVDSCTLLTRMCASGVSLWRAAHDVLARIVIDTIFLQTFGRCETSITTLFPVRERMP